MNNISYVFNERFVWCKKVFEWAFVDLIRWCFRSLDGNEEKLLSSCCSSWKGISEKSLRQHFWAEHLFPPTFLSLLFGNKSLRWKLKKYFNACEGFCLPRGIEKLYSAFAALKQSAEKKNCLLFGKRELFADNSWWWMKVLSKFLQNDRTINLFQGCKKPFFLGCGSLEKFEIKWVAEMKGKRAKEQNERDG